MPHTLRIRSLAGLAWRYLTAAPARTGLSVAAVTIAVSMTLGSEQVGRSVLNGFGDAPDAQIVAAGLWGQFESIMSLLGLLVSGTAAFMVFNALLMSVTHRRQQIGLLRTLGMTRRQVLRIVLVESLTISVTGAMLGLVLGPLIGQGLIAFLGTIGSEIFNNFGEAPLSSRRVLFAASLGVGLTLLATLFPAAQAARLSPLAALRLARSDGVDRGPRWRLVAGAAIIVVLFGWLVVAPPARWVRPPADWQLTAMFALLWFTGVALLIPQVLDWWAVIARRPLQSMLGAVGRLAADNLTRSRSRVTLTAAALAIGVALIIGMSGLTRFFMSELFGPRFAAGAEERVIGVFAFDLAAGAAAYQGLEEIRLSDETVAAFKGEIGEDAIVSEWRFLIVPELSFMMPNYFSYILDPELLRESGDWVFEFAEGDWDSALPRSTALLALIAAPLVSMLAAWLPARAALRGSAISLLNSGRVR